MNFIELTSVQGKKTIINADRISSVCPSELSGGGVILVVNEEAFYFRESYSRLKEMLLPLEINFGGSNGVPNCAKGEEHG